MVPNRGGLNTAGYEATARGFDALAAVYDDLVEANPLHALMRARSLAWLDEAFRPGMRVLEVGCGTGTEAVHLAQRDIDIVATDISPAMVATARKRVESAGIAPRVRVLECASGQLSQALKGARFDGAFASFGALNCEPHLDHAVREIAGLVRAKAPFLVSLVNRPCVAELAFGSVGLDFQRAFRRLRTDTTIDLYGFGSVRSRAYSEAELQRSLRPWFDVERIEGWLVALPPPYLARQWSRMELLHRALESLDGWLGRAWPFRGWGDHIHAWSRRRET